MKLIDDMFIAETVKITAIIIAAFGIVRSIFERISVIWLIIEASYARR